MNDRDRFLRADASDNNLLKQIIVGKGFVFLPETVFKQGSLKWVNRMLGRKERSTACEIVPLLGREPMEFFGVKIKPTDLEKLCLATITSDKPLYKAEKDQVNLLVLNPLSPHVNARVDVFLNDQDFSSHIVELGKHGEGSLALSDLPVGDYEVYLEAESRCKFTVAEYRLVPLVASIVESKAPSANQMSVVLQVESFGTPVSGDVNVFVMDDDMRTAAHKTTCIDGQLRLTVELKGAGPFSLNLQLVKDPMKTATVPLRGTRKEERTQTVFSPLGTEVTGSLLEDPTAQEVRGIYLADGATRTSPFRLEQVDAASAKLIANTKIDKVSVVAINPAHPRALSCVVSRQSAQHPETYDEDYRRASKMFNEEKDFAGAAKLFESGRARHDLPHPYYSYWIACCKAKMGHVEEAIVDLKRSLSEGWDEFDHLACDDDLANLRGHHEFELLLSAGLKELVVEGVEAGQVIEIAGFAPTTIIAVGAMVNGKPWEGWASLVTPCGVNVSIVTPKDATPGKRVEIEIACKSKSAAGPDSQKQYATIYGVIKDARLASADTPYTRLAAAIKSFVESAGKTLPVGFAQKDLFSIDQELARTSIPAATVGMRSIGGFGGADSWGSPPTGMAFRQAIPSAPVAQAQPAGGAGWAAQDSGVMWGGSLGVSEPTVQCDMAAPPASAGASAETNVMTSDPEVLFAGFLPVNGEKAVIAADLPDCFADYIVECFAIDGLDWNYAEARFRAQKYPFATMTTPAFASDSEQARGRVHVLLGDQKVRVQLLKDGKPQELMRNGTQVDSGELLSQSQDLEFIARPGRYEATLTLEDGTIASECARQVDQPGRLKRRVRQLRLLEEGQSIAIADGGGLVRLKAMPGIENSFKVLVEATADYSHCCCEQTAAKILSGCAMYLLSEDQTQQKKAEAVILAGIRREKSMWLKGKGFKVYPEGPNHADNYLGLKAATYLWNLSLIGGGGDHGGDNGGGNGGNVGSGGSAGNATRSISTDLKEAIEDGLKMAQDATKAYGIHWPPKNFSSCSDAYAALRFGRNGTANQALKYVANFVAESAKAKVAPAPAGVPPYMGRMVCDRTEKGYAAAALLRAGGAGSMAQALKLADEVVSQFNEEGRLYSTCDSVAAIALMSELQASGVTGGGAEVEIDGRKMSIQEANLFKDPIAKVKVLKGVATIAADRVIEEDWSQFSMSVAMRVSLEKDGKAVSRFSLGDEVNLVVSLDNGYVNGDLVWVCLPDALSRVIGGGQVKLFSLDFEGKSKVIVPLAVTASTTKVDGSPQSQSFAVCVRNMFDEERGGSPGLMEVTVI